jgi:hypothetical protein
MLHNAYFIRATFCATRTKNDEMDAPSRSQNPRLSLEELTKVAKSLCGVDICLCVGFWAFSQTAYLELRRLGNKADQPSCASRS